MRPLRNILQAGQKRPQRLRIAYGSCQKYEAGYWSAYDALVADAPDLVLFLPRLLGYKG